MKKLPVSRLIVPILLLAIAVFDIFVAVSDFRTNNAKSGVFILIMAAIIGYTGVMTIIRIVRKNK